MAKLNNTDHKDGGNEVFKRVKIHMESGTLTPAAFAHEWAAWNNAQYENTKTELQIKTEVAASNSAQIREMVKALNSVKPAVESLSEALESIGLKAIPISGGNPPTSDGTDSLSTHPSRH